MSNNVDVILVQHSRRLPNSPEFRLDATCSPRTQLKDWEVKGLLWIMAACQVLAGCPRKTLFENLV